MSKTSSGLFSGTDGTRIKNNPPNKTSIKDASHALVISWAKIKAKELHGKTKKNFNTAAVVYDEASGRYFYGRNGGYREENYKRNVLLFGDATHEGLLPKESLNMYPVGNCAEVDAVNRALNAGAKLENLHLTTIHTTKKQFGEYKPSCQNCTYTFKNRIKENYSGWTNN